MSDHRPSIRGGPSGTAGWVSPGTWAAAGLCAGAAGGAAAAALDWLRLLPHVGQALADGTLRLLAFLVCLYGGALGAAGLLAGIAAALLGAFTAAGPLWRAAGTGPGGTQAEAAGVPLRALLVAGVAGLVALGAALHGPALHSLYRFHHRTLIALLVAAMGTGLVLPVAALALLALAVLSRVPGLRGGRRAPLSLHGPPALYATGWAIGLLGLAGALTLAMIRLQLHPRMNAPLRALNLALLAPGLALVSLGIGHVAGRLLAGRAPAGLVRFGWRPAGWLLPLFTLAAPIGVFAISYRETLRLLDLRPFSALGVAVATGGIVTWLLSRRRAPLSGRLRPVLCGVLLLGLWGGALLLGQADRVRKAALAHAALAAPLVQGLQSAFDLDRDGHPSRWVVGGSDCDDLDPSVHPGAFDWPGDGIDQNCNGHQAQLPEERVRPFAPPPGVSLPQRPNIILLTIDALRADHVGCYGYGRDTTPNLDALAKGGVRFASAWAHAPSTRYSVPAILTGRYPATIAWGSPSQHWPPEVLPDNRLLAEVLRDRGYHTMALLSYHYFEPSWGLGQGVDEYDVHLMTLHSIGGDPAATSGSSARELADLAVRKIEERAAQPGRPFFLWTHFYDPHYRYQPHPEVPVFGDGRGEIDFYDGEVRYTDLHLGRVLEALRRTGAWERSVVIVTADHGEGFGEHGIPPDRRHGYHLYANQTRVPLILSLPGVKGGQVVPAPAGHVDIFPTVLQLAGGQAADEPQLAGRSLLSLLGDGTEDRVVFQEVMYEGPTVRKALVTERWHYVRNVIPDGTSELYDLAMDPQEEHDLQGRPAVLTAEADLSRRLSAWMDEEALPRDFQRRVAGNLSAAPIPVGQPVGATLGDLLLVVGADVVTKAVPRGGTAEVAVVLRALRRIPPGWRMFMHLRGRGGFVNADHDPVEGLVPLQQLRPGHYVRDVVRIAVPASWPAGEATLDVGLFRHKERAPVTGPAALISPGERLVRAARVVVR